ncbi:BUD17 [Candida oxycetoniae]|uniref:pyridoxal kinase n=1 Tax=Candida oxycetoniae TaxID=497107 RepID=A0AAI9SWF5_9ASCO|nr:BUD17 [Candida oxycetoniae]KAI3404217.2 BUD17 [Candida oxycetoniae]
MKTLLSISSHVVHGYVGNRAMTFPLQYMGWDVDAINTTNFSNHPGYGSLQGSTSTVDTIESIISGLSKILSLPDFDLILIGYCPNADVLSVVHKEISKALGKQEARKKLRWIVDPVLGDNGKLYVSEKVIPVYIEILTSGLVSLITPNQFEFETLSGEEINSWESCKDALEKFATKFKVENIVISSVSIDNALYCVAYTQESIFYLPIERIDCDFNGCGDLFTGLIANAYYNDNYKITPKSISNVLSNLHEILQYSYLDELKINNFEPKVVKDIRVVAAKYLLEENGKELVKKIGYL